MNSEEELRKDFINYLKKLEYLYLKANTISKKRKIAIDLNYIEGIVSDFLGIDYPFCWSNDVEIYNFEDSNLFFDSINKDKNKYHNISKNIIDIFSDSNFPFYKMYNKQMHKLSYDDINYLVLSFLNDLKKKSGIYIPDLKDNDDIYVSNIYGYDGLTFTFQNIDKNIVFIENSMDKSLSMSYTIAHELGHVYEASLFRKTGINFDKSFNTPFYEIVSCFFEYAFLNYLKENNVLEEDTNILLHNYYISLFSSFYNIHILSNFDVTKEEYIITGKNTIDKIENIKEKVNFYDLPSKCDAILTRNAYIYGIGRLISIYLYDLYKKDSTNFRKRFNNFLLNYPNSSDLSVAEMLNIREKDLVEGSAVKKVLKRDN